VAEKQKERLQEIAANDSGMLSMLSEEELKELKERQAEARRRKGLPPKP
jgi:hypothetical protein